MEVFHEAAKRADIEARGIARDVEPCHTNAAFGDLLRALDPIEHEYMGLQAIRATRFRRYLPWEAARVLQEPFHSPGYVQNLLNDRGELDATALDNRLVELRGLRR